MPVPSAATAALLYLVSTGSTVLVVAVVTAVSAGVSFGILGPRPSALRRHPEWPERARITWPARIGGSLTVLAMTAAGVVASVLAGPVRIPDPGLGIACAVTAWWVVTRLRGWQERRLSPDPGSFDVRRFRRGRTAWVLVQYSQTLALISLMAAGFQAPPGPFLAAAIPAGMGVVWFGLRGGGLDLAKRLGLASSPEPWLEELTRARATAAEVSVARVDVIEWDYANAFAFSLPRRVAVTRGALDALTREQLGSVLDHEIGHLAEPPAVRRAKAARIVLLVPVVTFGPIVNAWGPAGALALLAGFVVLSLLARRLGRRMELRADAHAHEHGEDPKVYATALEALYRHNDAPAVLGTGVHPNLYDRMEAAGVTPAYPRPSKPGAIKPRAAAAVAIVLAAVLLVTARMLTPPLLNVLPVSVPTAALFGGDEMVHLDLAEAGRCEEARVVAQVADLGGKEWQALCP